ncbi:MAG: Ig-like domain-containing protein [Chromatiaceae bacterium]|nr:Ig-like domain-containing protein [Candidatus Thioaporhodococcus sediminis]
MPNWNSLFSIGLAAAGLISGLAAPGAVLAGGAHGAASAPSQVFAYWSEERRAAAIPRDLRIDPRGLGYLRHPDGTLEPHGHAIAAQQAAEAAPLPRAKPGGGAGDTTGPIIANMDPGTNATIPASYPFSATVTDSSGVRSVSFVIQYPNNGGSQTFSAALGTDNRWSVTLQGFTDGAWQWQVVAKDTVGKGNTTTSSPVSFTVNTNGGGGGGGGTEPVTNAEWTGDGQVQAAVGRLYFEMPSNSRRTRWTGYVCSGSVVDDAADDRSVILTAAHCVYDDANKAFARNVMFIPDQASTTGGGTDLNCGNDPYGCWVPAFGVVDANWTTRTFPDNIPWDYAFYVVSDTGAHSGAGSYGALDAATGALALSFAPPLYDESGDGDFTHALGYSYSEDPNFMYCAEDMTTEGTANWWLPSCGLSGGSSGGPWIQPLDATSSDGPVISVNSWGYTTSPGMAGPKLSGTSAACLFDTAKSKGFADVPITAGNAGVAPLDCSN